MSSSVQNTASNNKTSVKVYHGYGHRHNLVVYGHAFYKKAKVRRQHSKYRLFPNMTDLIFLFFVKPYPLAKLRMNWHGQILETTADEGGFFKFEWDSIVEVEHGWHPVSIDLINQKDEVVASGIGELYIPHITQYGFISDIDDTIMVSYSATIRKRLKELFRKKPETREMFKDVGLHYSLLAKSYTNEENPNPFFYVSSSEWNLYNYLNAFFRHNSLPKGVFLLGKLKRWFELFKTGKTGHQSKILRIVRILDAFPNQKFVLFGDNSQQDPEIYAAVSLKYTDRIIAIYIRNVREEKTAQTIKTLSAPALNAIAYCVYKHSSEAITHSKEIGLI